MREGGGARRARPSVFTSRLTRDYFCFWELARYRLEYKLEADNKSSGEARGSGPRVQRR